MKECVAAGMCYCVCDECRKGKRPAHCWEHGGGCHKGCRAATISF